MIHSLNNDSAAAGNNATLPGTYCQGYVQRYDCQKITNNEEKTNQPALIGTELQQP